MVLKILLDTNFILTCVKQKIDFENFLNEKMDEKIEFLVPQQVLNELGNLKDRAGMKTIDKKAAELSFEYLRKMQNKPKIIQLKDNFQNVDIAIVNYLLGKNIILATLDKDLKQRVDNKILTIRGKKNLGFV